MENVATISGSETSFRMCRSVAAVLAGLVTVIVTHTGWTPSCTRSEFFPRPGR